MQVYLVGGAVRDQLLGLPVKERDWVVVGGTPEAMLHQGFQQVGKDFPVFLHPTTREEYALARKERKTGPGYGGFACEASPSVTLQEDLLRRDLTINAMALDDNGQLIDFYGGQQDLNNKVLKHVSDAFVEDPVRVLRLARFKARFHALGFTIAEDTSSLVYQMVENGELAHLVPERVWREWENSLHTPHPAQFIEALRAFGALRVLIPEIDALFGVPAGPFYHPEIDTGVHVLQMLHFANTRQTDAVLSFAIMMHDLGKALTPKASWPSHPAHDTLGEAPIQALCERLKVPSEFRDTAIMGCRYHLKMHQGLELSPEEVLDVLVGSGAFRQGDRFSRLLDLYEADALAAFPDKTETQRPFWMACLQACLSISSTTYVKPGMDGKQIQAALFQARIERIREVLGSA
ncbi:MAG: multifunctional CCA addition/repair protein [Gammaproteobacteria bacterium]|nr:multifunctional CCA addition/repair protein [Gammaproteobacteria bacterium]